MSHFSAFIQFRQALVVPIRLSFYMDHWHSDMKFNCSVLAHVDNKYYLSESQTLKPIGSSSNIKIHCYRIHNVCPFNSQLNFGPINPFQVVRVAYGFFASKLWNHGNFFSIQVPSLSFPVRFIFSILRVGCIRHALLKVSSATNENKWNLRRKCSITIA